MGRFVPAPLLRTGEVVLWQCQAARQTSTFVNGGGRLFLTTTRLIHQPSRIPFGRPWSTQRTNISRVRVAPRRPDLALLGMMSRWRNRLRVELADGSVQVFLVNHLDKVLADLGASLANDAAPPPTDRPLNRLAIKRQIQHPPFG